MEKQKQKEWMDDFLNQKSVAVESEAFQEAIAYIKQKVVLSYFEYRNIRVKYKTLAFSVAGYTQLDILNQFYQELLSALEEGTTIQQFRRNMNDFLGKKGYKGLTKNRSDMIFRTNLQTAYQVGHYKQMTQKDVMKKRPYWRYRTAGDGRVRETHTAMDGKVYYANSPIWDMWFPPNGFGCRCSVVSLTKEQVKRNDYEVETEPPYYMNPDSKKWEIALPEKAFRTNPAKTEWKPDLAGFPKVLKKAWKEREKKKP